jgi:hypothetical protein
MASKDRPKKERKKPKKTVSKPIVGTTTARSVGTVLAKERPGES